MPTVPHIVQFRNRRRERERRNPSGRLGLFSGGLLSLALAAGAILLPVSYARLSANLPPLQALPALLEPPGGLLLQPTRLYDRSGEHLLATLEEPAARNRQYLRVPASDQPGVEASGPAVSGNLVTATIAALDPAFWEHPGYLLPGIGFRRPTLAERLVTGLLLWDEPPGLARDLRARLLAGQVTAHFGREKVLEWYLNSAYYGRLAYGADAAAWLYLGKSAGELSLAEASLLAAVGEEPALNPIDAPQQALERQQKLILAMLDQGAIEPAAAEQAAQEVITFQPAKASGENIAPSFTSLALEQVYTQIDRTRLERGGFRVITTLDYDLQAQSGCAAQAQIARLAGASGDASCEAARLLPTIPGDPASAQGELAAHAIVLDPYTGQVLALAGSSSQAPDPARLPGRPPGTLMTPFIYLTAFTRGLSPGSLVWDIPAGAGDGTAAIRPVDYKGPVRLRMALANDYLSPALQMENQFGIENIWRTARQLGLVSMDAPGARQAASLLDEGLQVTLLETVQAYGVLDAGGVLAGRILETQARPPEPSPLSAIAVLRVVDAAGKAWLDWSTPHTRPVITPQLAYLATQVLSDESARWPSLGHPSALEIGRPAAAKMGTTAAGKDTWTVGYTPQLVAGVWIGNPGSENPAAPPPEAAAGLWHALIQYASRELPSRGWETPPGISRMDVCDPSGMLPTANCPAVVNEVFLSGSEPTQVDNLFRSVQINRETGRLATVYTPAELVEEKVFLIAPPEAQEWARQVGLPLPPESYDVIASPAQGFKDVSIASPEMFAYVSGKVVLRGTAAGEGLDFFRVQVGKGLNPQQWLQVGQDVEKPVVNGALAEWDTTGLNGLYVVQLLVVRADQSADSAMIQVSIDNTPPLARILSPLPGQELAISQARSVVLEAQAEDELSLQRVEFWLDGKKLAELTQGPFTTPPQQLKAGNHSLLVRAFDRAGNFSETTTQFSVR